MSFASRALLAGASAGPVNPLSAMSLEAFNGSGGGASATINFNTNGTISYTSGFGATAWYSPTTTSIGSSYWVKFTLASGNAWNTGLTAGTVYALSSQRSLTWSVGSVGVKLATVTVQIYSDAGGTALVTSGTLSVDVAGESGA